MGLAARLDKGQRKHSVLGLPIAVLYKFWDDQGAFVAAAVTYYAFIAIFPLMLMATSILGYVVGDDAELQQSLLNSALGQFPIIGDQLGRPEGLHGSTSGLVFGSIVAIYGAMGLGLAVQNASNTAWSVPRNSRPNVVLMRFRSIFLLATAGMAVIAISMVSVLGSNTNWLGGQLATHWIYVVQGATVLVVGLALTFVMRYSTTRDHSLRESAPGAFALALMWQGLQWLGALYVDGVINKTTGMNATFALVLGLLGYIYFVSMAVIVGIEVNVVISRRLWPRALLTPFTDSVDLTEADRRAYASYALMQRHKGFETVSVAFEGRDGDTHEIVMDPSWMQKATRKLRTRLSRQGHRQIEDSTE